MTYNATGKKGLLSTVQDANSRTITYAYTSRNQLYTVVENSATTTYSYDNNGNETGITNPNSTTVTKVYDDAGRLSSVTNKNSGNTTLSSFSYAYNNDDLVTSCTEASGDVVSYGYSANHRLTGESRTGASSYSRSYTLDGVGNRTAQTAGGTTTSFTINSDDELTATSGGFTNSYSYNSNGEQTGRTLSGTAWTLAYDYEGQLTSTATGGSTVSSFAYDALGRRYSRTNGGTTTRFYYGPGGVLVEKAGGSFTAAYAYGNSLIRRGSEFPLFDGLGSQRTVTNGSQTVTATAIYEGFGQTIATTGSTGNPYGFGATSANRVDGDVDLMYTELGYQDINLGRLLTTSPAQSTGNPPRTDPITLFPPGQRPKLDPLPPIKIVPKPPRGIKGFIEVSRVWNPDGSEDDKITIGLGQLEIGLGNKHQPHQNGDETFGSIKWRIPFTIKYQRIEPLPTHKYSAAARYHRNEAELR